MRVVHVCGSIKGGAGAASWRLHQALLQQGIDSWYITREIGYAGSEALRWQKALPVEQRKPLVKKLFDRFDPSSERNVRVAFQTVRQRLDCEAASLPYSHVALHHHELMASADLVHLHWVNGLLHYPDFFRHWQKPIVWTAHDQYAARGLFHFGVDEERNASVRQLDLKARQIKQDAYAQHRFKKVMVSPSLWMKCWMEKQLLVQSFVHEEIANGVCLDRLDKAPVHVQRSQWPANRPVILFAANAVGIYRKGFDLLKAAASILAERGSKEAIWLAIGRPNDEHASGVQFHYTGYVDGEEAMASWYKAADVVVLPSREDNLPNVMVEAMACGKPVVAFNTGGMAQHIHDGINGCKASEMTAEALADAIELALRTTWSSHTIQQYARTHFHDCSMAEKHIVLYQQTLQ